MYTTAINIVDHADTNTLVEVLTPRRFSDFEADCLAAVVHGSDTSNFSAIVIEAANAVVDLINSTIINVSSEMDLSLNKHYQTPITNNSTLTDIATSISLYRLLGHSANDYQKDRNNQSLKLLNQIANGSVQLSAQDTQQGAGEVLSLGTNPSSITDGY